MRTDDFNRACDLEMAGDLEGAETLYRMILASVDDARACVNLGVIHFNRHEYGMAADLYRRATKIAPNYAIAWFNLATTLDELRGFDGATEAFQTALRISPQYADAHYNYALMLDQHGHHRRALKHWRAYLKLEPAGAWADHARSQVRKTLKADPLKIVWRRAA